MFKFLKDKLKGAISKFSKKVEETSEDTDESIEEIKEEPTPIEPKPDEPIEEKEPEVEEVVEEPVIEEPSEDLTAEVDEIETETKPSSVEGPEGSFIEEPFSEEAEKPAEEPKPKEDVSEPVEESKPVEDQKPEEVVKEPEKKQSVLKRLTQPITRTTISEKKFEELFWDLEVVLMESNVAVEVIEKIKEDLKQHLTTTPIRRGKVTEEIMKSLKQSLKDILSIDSFDLIAKIETKKPYVICFVGINGSGKTTSIAKFAKKLLNENLTCVLAAADTFRAAAIDQLQKHADALGVKLIKQDYGSDPAAVAFDAVQHAKAKHIDAVLIDTAGRLHSNENLLDEMKKIVRVAKPDALIFVGESITGNDCVEQAKKFNEVVELDGIILSKADIDEKGGAAVSVSYVTKKPVLYIGTGQTYNDLEAFDPDKIMASLGL